MTTEWLSVRVRWLRTGDVGRLLLHRQQAGFDEYWLSVQMNELSLASRHPAALADHVWQPLLRGLQVDDFDLIRPMPAVALKAATGSQPRGVPLAEAKIWWVPEEGRLVTRRAVLRISERELLARFLAGGIRDAIAGLGIDLMASKRHQADPPSVHVRNSRGVQVGDHNTMVNKFESDSANARQSFDTLLVDPEVLADVTKLIDRPSDGDRLAELLGKLRRKDPEVRSRPVILPPGKEAEVLGRVAYFGPPVVQVGGNNTFNVIICTNDSALTEEFHAHEELIEWAALHLGGDRGSVAPPRIIDSVPARSPDGMNGRVSVFRVQNGPAGGLRVDEISLQPGLLPTIRGPADLPGRTEPPGRTDLPGRADLRGPGAPGYPGGLRGPGGGPGGRR